MKKLGDKIIECSLGSEKKCKEGLLSVKDVKKSIKRIMEKMNCGWRVDVIKEEVGSDLL